MKITNLLFAGLVGLFAVTAQAEQIRFASTVDTVGTPVQITGSSFDSKRVAIGSYLIDQQGDGLGAFLAFCVDPYQPAIRQYSEYTISDLDATDFNTDQANRFTNVNKLFDNAYASLAGDDIQTAGFHLALWEIFHDDLDVTTGGIQGIGSTNQLMLTAATGFLDSLSTWDTQGLYSLTFYQNDQNQDFLSAALAPAPAAVPVPAALPLFMSALAGFGIMRRRKATV